VSWTDLSAGIPDIPADTIRVGGEGSLLVGTDLGLLERTSPGAWERVVDVPGTVVTRMVDGKDGKTYIATFGRGLYVAPRQP
jgi:hypothetical protein